MKIRKRILAWGLALGLSTYAGIGIWTKGIEKHAREEEEWARLSNTLVSSINNRNNGQIDVAADKVDSIQLTLARKYAGRVRIDEVPKYIRWAIYDYRKGSKDWAADNIKDIKKGLVKEYIFPLTEEEFLRLSEIDSRTYLEEGRILRDMGEYKKALWCFDGAVCVYWGFDKPFTKNGFDLHYNPILLCDLESAKTYRSWANEEEVRGDKTMADSLRKRADWCKKAAGFAKN